MSKYKGKTFTDRIKSSSSSLKSNRFNIKKNTDLSKVENILSGIISTIENIIKRVYSLIRDNKKIAIGIATGIAIAFIVILIVDFNKVQSLASYQPDITTRIYDKNNVLISEFFTEKREVVPFEEIPKNLINAFIASEDNEFYDHWGINPKGIVRAFFVNIFAGGVKQGGSTITQQLAKILLTSRERSLYRKVKEAFIALMIEFKYSKGEILNLYLNQIFLGHGAYGVESASKIYFQKNVQDLNLAQCALLATLPSAPNLLSPIRHPKTSIARHKIILGKMVEMGFITVKEAEKAFLDFWPEYLDYIGDLPPTLTTWSTRIDRAPWFTEYIRRDLVKKYGEDMVFSGGLSVYTTLDVNKQMAGQRILKAALDRQSVISTGLSFKNDDFVAESFSDEISLLSYVLNINPFRKKGSVENTKINNHLRAEVVEELEGINFIAGLSTISDFLDKYKRTYTDDKELQRVEGCIISINNNNGYIEAMIGGGEFSSINQLNRTMQSRRQPGSSIKPLLYSAAIESGMFTPATTVLDSPILFLDSDGSEWLPENYERDYNGFVRLRKALEKSINVVSIRIAETIGIDMVINYYAKLLRLNDSEKNDRIPRNLSIALGSIDVSPFEMTRAYAIIANGGRDIIPFSIRYIKDRDNNIIENREEEINKIIEERTKNGSIQIIRPDTAQVMISMMKSVISSGTARAASIGRPVAGKTGTTNNWKDAWFIGFTPNISTGIWIGYDKLGLSLGAGQAAAGIAAPIWGNYMREALKSEAATDFPAFANLAQIVICENSGMLPSTYCQHTITEVFMPQFVPEQVCDICSKQNADFNMSIKPPEENIMENQKQKILKNFKDNKNESIIDNIGNDLLQ
ncbi:MAG: PBP1A family penicillin-binding protein [Leptospirales bacterium]|nr:PBP1A family penicillin-binding protein [Leptospirales bacterium]